MDEVSVRKQILEETEERIREFIERCCPSAPDAVRIGDGEVVREIVRIAAAEGADYLVVGTERHGMLRELVIGSTTHEILRHAPCPVLVVPLREGRRSS